MEQLQAFFCSKVYQKILIYDRTFMTDECQKFQDEFNEEFNQIFIIILAKFPENHT